MPVPTTTQTLQALAFDRSLVALAQAARRLPEREVVDAMTAMPPAEAAVLLRLLDKDVAAAVFDRLDTAAQADLVRELGDRELAEVFGAVDADTRAQLIDELPARVAKRLIAAVDRDDVAAAMVLLGYPAGSVGRRMAPVELHAVAAQTAGEVLERLRASERPLDDLALVPVLAPDRILLGAVDPLVLLRADPDDPVTSVMDPDPDFASTHDDVERVARRQLDRGELLLPVVDRERRLVGMLPILEAAEVDKDAVAEDQARAGAHEPLRRPYLLTPVLRLTRTRAVWLLVLAVSAVLTVNVLSLFEATLEQQVALALFIPLLTGTGGNTGSQAAVTVTRALALGELELRDLGRVAFKEVRTGLALGVLLGALAFAVGALVYGWEIGLVLGLTLVLNLPIAATVGGAIPMVARACRVDPAVFSTPFISTFCDASGLLVYFSVAIAVLGIA